MWSRIDGFQPPHLTTLLGRLAGRGKKIRENSGRSKGDFGKEGGTVNATEETRGGDYAASEQRRENC
jgi:hypothetical protein